MMLMKCALLYGPFDLRVEDQDQPKIGLDEVLVRIKACGVCGTDINAYVGKKPKGWVLKFPYRLGHEVAGTVEEVGKKVYGVFKGDDVVADGRVSCGRCSFCRRGVYNLCTNQSYIAGGFTEYNKYPFKNLIKIPKNLSIEEAAFTEPLACCVNGIEKLDAKLGSSGIVIGDGPIGMLHLQLLRNRGVSTIMIGHHDHRLKVAEKLGAETTINSKTSDALNAVKRLTDGRGLDIVVFAVASEREEDCLQAETEGFKMLAKRGQMLLFAATHFQGKPDIDLDSIHYNELRVVGSHDSTIGQYETALKLLSSGAVNVKPLITHTLPLEKIKEGFEIASERKGLKVLIKPGMS